MRDNLAVLPCSTQFTISEFEEYFFHRENVRIVVRSTHGPMQKGHDLVINRGNHLVRTSHFEHLLRKCKGGRTDGNVCLHELIRDVKKGSNIGELAVVFGNGALVEYDGSMMVDGIDVGRSCLPETILRTFKVSSTRNSYSRPVDSFAADFERTYEFENMYRSGG